MEKFVSFIKQLVRPMLTTVLVVPFVGTLTYLVIQGTITVDQYFQYVGQQALMIVAFWFGERSGKKQKDGKG